MARRSGDSSSRRLEQGGVGLAVVVGHGRQGGLDLFLDGLVLGVGQVGEQGGRGAVRPALGDAGGTAAAETVAELASRAVRQRRARPAASAASGSLGRLAQGRDGRRADGRQLGGGLLAVGRRPWSRAGRRGRPADPARPRPWCAGGRSPASRPRPRAGRPTSRSVHRPGRCRFRRTRPGAAPARTRPAAHRNEENTVTHERFSAARSRVVPCVQSGRAGSVSARRSVRRLTTPVADAPGSPIVSAPRDAPRVDTSGLSCR